MNLVLQLHILFTLLYIIHLKGANTNGTAGMLLVPLWLARNTTNCSWAVSCRSQFGLALQNMWPDRPANQLYRMLDKLVLIGSSRHDRLDRQPFDTDPCGQDWSPLPKKQYGSYRSISENARQSTE
jgi:hypothetical protein